MTEIIVACTPILVALIGIIPTILATSKKTRDSVQEQNQATQSEIAKVKGMLINHIKEDEDDKARNARYRILRFYDEICEGRRHSESHFEDILDDIDRYELYCQNHPDYKNSRGHVAMRNIRETYERLKANGKFLAHERDKEV